MSLARFLLTLKARWLTAVLVLATVLAVTALVSALLPKQYSATSMVLVDIKSADPLAVSAQQQSGQAAAIAVNLDPHAHETAVGIVAIHLDIEIDRKSVV